MDIECEHPGARKWRYFSGLENSYRRARFNRRRNDCNNAVTREGHTVGIQGGKSSKSIDGETHEANYRKLPGSPGTRAHSCCVCTRRAFYHRSGRDISVSDLFKMV